MSELILPLGYIAACLMAVVAVAWLLRRGDN